MTTQLKLKSDDHKNMTNENSTQTILTHATFLHNKSKPIKQRKLNKSNATDCGGEIDAKADVYVCQCMFTFVNVC